MSEAFQYVRASLMCELVRYRTIAGADKRRKEEPARGQQLNFWLGNAIFWIVQLQISDEEGDSANYSEAFNKTRECLDRLQILLS
jgi:hypothetical protein